MPNVLTDAFPAALEAKVLCLAPVLTKPSAYPPSEPFTVSCDGAILAIPYRIYHPPARQEELVLCDGLERSIIACWFTRHHDGRTREAFLRSLPAYESSWAISYVMALCGEYVVELLDYIWAERSRFDHVLLGRWLSENRRFYARTRSRIVSYWNCYYRSSYPQLRDYVGGRLAVFFDEHLAGQSEVS